MPSGTGRIADHRLAVDMSERIAELNPDASPLIVLTKKMKKKRVVTRPEYDWMEQDIGSRWDKVSKTGGLLATATSIDVANEGYFRKGDVVKVPRTGETMLVTDVDYTDHQIEVIRSWGAVDAAALNDKDPLVIISNANAEGATLREILPKEPVKKSNYTQIIRTPVGVTGTLDATKTMGPKAMAWYRHVDGINHAIDMERTMWFSEKGKDTFNGQPRRTTGGVLEFLNTNILDVSTANGVVTEQAFTEWMESVFAKGSSDKFLFACGRLCTTIDLWGMGKLRTLPKEKTYGVAIKEFVTTHGTLYIVKNKLFEGAVYGGYGVVLDLDNVAFCPLDGRDTKLLTDRQANDEDAKKDEYLSEFGVEVRLPETHAVIKGVA